MKPALFLTFLALTLPAAAADYACQNAYGSLTKEIAGFKVVIAPATDDAHKAQCRAAITSADDKTVFEAYSPQFNLEPISGRDVNADDKPDVVFSGKAAEPACCYSYWIVSLGEQPGLVREFTTTAQLNFEDKLGDGKVEIWGRDNAFDGFDRFPSTESPFPLVFLRMKGANIYNVSQIFWPEYEREIAQAKAALPRSATFDLTREEQDKKGGGNPEAHDPKDEELMRDKALVLEIALNYLYGGKGQQAWQTISDMWPPLDRQRVRQQILMTRMKGLLSEINRQPKPAPAQ